MKRLFILALFFCAQQVLAQAGIANTVYNESNLTATDTGDSVYLTNMKSNHWVARITSTEDSGTASLTGRIDHSPDCTTWSTLLTFTAQTATGGEDVHVNSSTTAVYPCVRGVATITGTGQWDVKIVLFGE